MATYFLPASSDVFTFLYNFTQKLVTTDGLWTVVEAYDADNAGTKRRTPTGGAENTLQNAAFLVGGAFSWAGDSALAANDWIVLRSTGAGTKCQVCIRVVSATSLLFWMIPTDDFTTGGADVSPPVLSATSFGTTMGTTSTGSNLAVQATMTYTGRMTADAFVVSAFDGATFNTRVMFAGKALSDLTGDTRPFCLVTNPSTMAGLTGTPVSRVAPDGVTFLSTGTPVFPSAAGSSVLGAGLGAMLTPGPTKYLAEGARFHFSTINQRHLVGFEGCYFLSSDLSASGTVNGLTIAYWSGGGTRFGFGWDGITAI